jgi:hypothetical protein
MLGKRIINTGAAGAACTTDTVQILDGVPFDSIATYELESDATNSIKSGYIGNGATFNGSSSYVDTGISSLSGAFSVSLWINEISLASGSMFGNWNSTSADDIYIRTNSSGQLILGIDGISNQTFGSSGDISVNTWHHIVMTFNNGTVEAYLDGDSLGTSTTGNTSFSSGRNFVIGADSTKSNASHFNGTIDEVRIYNTALTAGNVATLYAETASSTISISGLLAHYKLEGDATDETGNYDGTASNVIYNEYDGTATNVTYATGKFGNAAVFNGSSSKIELPFNLQNTAFSVSFWAKNTLDSNNYYLIANNSGSAQSGWHIGGANSSGTVYNFRINNGSSNYLLLDSGTVDDSDWHHVVVTWDNTTNANGAKIYINGSLSSQGTSTSSTNFSFTNSTIQLMAEPSGSLRSNGNLDQVRIYDKAISAANVSTLYAETLATSQTNISLNTPSGVAYYKMNDATDETGSYDASVQLGNFNIAGKFGNAVSFDGVLNSGMVTGQNWGRTNDFAISVWVKDLGVGTAGYQYKVLVQNYKDDYLPFGYDTTNKLFNFPVHDGTTLHKTLVTASNIDTSYWRHLVLTQKLTGTGAGAFLYLDGNLEDSYIGAITQRRAITSASYTSTTIAKNQTGQANLALEGRLDQVRLFDRFISSDEVTTLYNEVYCQPTIVPTDHFETVLYTGAGATNTITGVGFQPDLVWIKDRDAALNHLLADTVRGISTDSSNTTGLLLSNLTNAELTNRSEIRNLSTDGFDVTGTGSGSNTTGHNFVSWNWKAGGGAVSNTDGTITSQVSASTEAGFSIVKWTGNNTAQTIGHGLDSAPELIITKGLTTVTNWGTYSATLGATKYLVLDGTNGAISTTAAAWNNTDPTSSVFSVGTGFNYTSGIAYCFHSVDGMSKIGSYVGTNAGGHSIVTGFRPKFLLTKRSSADGGGWNIFDSERGTDKRLYPHLSNAEGTDSPEIVKFNSNGFTLNTADSWNNGSYTYIYLAFAEEGYNPNGLTRNASDPFGDSSEVAFYKFEDDATDSTGSNDGTFTTPSYATGYIDKAAVFNGSSSYINLPGVIDKDNDTDYSFSMWVNFNSTFTSGGATLFGIDTNNPPFASYLYGHSDGIGISMERYYGTTQEYANNYNTAAKFNFSTNTWYHIAGVYDASASTGKIYVNGSLIGTHNLVVKGTNRTIVNSVRLGANGSSAYFDGKIDQVRIFDRALDSGEVTQLYNE